MAIDELARHCDEREIDRIETDEQIATFRSPVRCLSKEQAAAYLGIGVTLLTELQVPYIAFGRRRVYDRLDLDAGSMNIRPSEGGPERRLAQPRPVPGQRA